MEIVGLSSGESVDPGIRELEIMAQATRYNAWIVATVAPYLGQTVLEVGCGIGTMTAAFRPFTRRIIALDPSDAAVAQLAQRFGEAEGVVPLVREIGDPDLPAALREYDIDTVLFVNVLEHILEDQQALDNAAALLSPRGRVVVLAPAHQALYGSLDAVVGHHRRYDRSDLEQKLRRAGLQVERSFYFNSVGAVGRFMIGKVLRQQQTGQGQVSVFDRLIVPVMSRVESVVRPPFGQSLVCVASKAAGPQGA